MEVLFRLPESEWEAAAEALCARLPERMPEIRSRLEIIRKIGFAGPLLRPYPDRLGDYRLLRLLGGGGMGVVYLAEQESMKRKVALKLIKSEQLYFPQAKARFRREVEAVSRLDHPGICTVYDAGEIEGLPYIAMRYLEGETLAQRIQEACRAGGRAASGASGSNRRGVLEAAHMIEKAARAVHAAHEAGLVHRDIKPANLMVLTGGEPVLLDFGLARVEAAGGQEITQSGAFLGTPAYMAPEQITGRGGPADIRSDVYGLGATLYEALTLEPPFAAPTREELYREILVREPVSARRLNRAIPPDLEVVLEKAMAKERDRRYQSALDLAEELARVRRFEPIHARRVRPWLRLWRWCQRNPRAAILVALLTAALGAASGALIRSERALAAAEASNLAGASRAAEGSDQLKALLFAREAVRRQESVATLAQLHRALHELREEVCFAGHTGIVWSAIYAPKRKIIASASFDGTIKVWDLQGRCLCTRPGMGDPDGSENGVYRLALAPDEELLAASGYGGALLFRLLGDGTLLPLRELHRTEPGVLSNHIEFSADGRRLVLATEDGFARLFDREGNPIGVLGEGSERRNAAVWKALFSPCGDKVLTVGGFALQVAPGDATPILWARDGRRLALLEGHTGIAVDAAFTRDGSRIATCSWDRTARLWEVSEEGVTPGPELRGHQDQVFSVRFAPDGARILTASQDGSAILWDREGRLLATLRGHIRALWGAEFSPDGKWILTWSGDGTLRIHDAQGQMLVSLLGHRMGITHAGFVTTGEPGPPLVLSSSSDNTARLWCLDDPELPILRGHSGEVRAARFLACPGGGPWILTASTDGTARFWDHRGRELPGPPLQGLGRYALAEALGGRERFLVQHERHAALYSWEADRPCELWRTRTHARPLRHVAASADGSWVLSSELSVPSQGLLLASRAGEELATPWRDCLPFHFLPGDRLLLAQPETSLLFLCDRKANRVLRRVPAPGVSCVAPAGTHFLVGTRGGEAFLLDQAFTRVAALEPHGAGINDLRYSPDTGRILSASNDGTARLSDRRGNPLMVFQGHLGPVFSVDFSPDGRHVVTASADRTARVWFADPEELKRHVEKRLRGR